MNRTDKALAKAFHEKYPDWLHNPRCLQDIVDLFIESKLGKQDKLREMTDLITHTILLMDIAEAEGRDAEGLKSCIERATRLVLSDVNPDPETFIRCMVNRERMPPKSWLSRNEYWFFAGCIVLGFILASVTNIFSP